MSALTLKPRGETVGAEVVGLTVDDLHEENTLPAEIMAALAHHGALVFRELHVDDEDQIRFSQRLDQVGKRAAAPTPTLYTVSLDPSKSHTAEYTLGTFFWHLDGAQDEIPTKATVLSAKVVATKGGETEFASTYAAYDELGPDEQARVASLRVVHSFAASQRLVDPDPSPEKLARWREKPDREHPLVWRHGDGRRSLVIGATADRVVGLAPDESRALLDSLLDRATRPERVYRHEWAAGDLVIWDNTGVIHRACPYAPDSAREMRRTTMSGDEPIQ